MKKILVIAMLFLFAQVVILGQEARILFFNDFHGMMREQTTKSSYTPGIAKFMGAVEEQLKKYPDAIVISGGDNYQGDFLSSMVYGKPVSEMFKFLGVVFSAVGNHEFDWNSDLGKKKDVYFKNWEDAGGFKYLAANIVGNNTKNPVRWAKDYAIVVRNGLKIAFIGLSTIETPRTTSASNVADISFTDSAAAAKACIDKLAGENPDVIIALTHIPSAQVDIKCPKCGNLCAIQGNEINKLCNGAKGLSLVLSAHSHQFVNGTINGIPVIQAGCFGRGMGLGCIKITKNEGKPSIECEVVKITPETFPSEKGRAILDKYLNDPILKPYTEVIGFATDDFTRDDVRFSTMGRFTVDTLKKAANVDITFNNKGGIRTDLSGGNIWKGDIKSIFPFNNYVVKMDLRSDAVMEVLQNVQTVSSGLIPVIRFHDNTYDVVGGVLNGVKIDPTDLTKYYSVSVNDFMFGGGNDYNFPDYIKQRDGEKKARAINVEIRKDLEFYDIISKEIKAQRTITPVKGEYIEEGKFQIKAKPVKEKQDYLDAA